MSSEPSRFLVVSYQPANAPLALLQISDSLVDSTVVQLLSSENFNDHHAAIQSAGKALLILVLTKKEDLIGVLSLLAKFQTQIKVGLIRVFVFNLTDNSKVQGLLKTKGCRDFLEYSMTSKALLFKIHQTIQIVDKIVPGFLPSTIKNTPLVANASGEPTKLIRWTEPVIVQSDCWLLKSARDARNVQGMWLIEMLGPGPSAGSWTASPTGDGSTWDWIPKDPRNDPFIIEQGQWTFQGRQPEFNWKINRWQFVGAAPSLRFFYERRSYADRFAVDAELNLNFAKNSKHAHARLPLILAGLTPEVRVSPEKQEQTPVVLVEERSRASNDYLHDLVPEYEWAQGAEAFKSLDLNVKMKTLQQTVGDWSHVELLENSAREILISAPRGSLKQGQDVSFQFTAQDGPRTVYFVVSGMVRSTEIFDHQSMFVSIEFETESQSQLKDVAALVEKRQVEVLEFLKQAKGI